MPGGRRISLWSIIQNAVPNMANDSKDSDPDLSPQQMDDLLKLQLSLPQPRYLDVHSLLITGVVDNLPTAEKVFKALIKHGYITPKPEKGAEAPASPMTVDTKRIGKDFSSKLAMVSIHAHRRLVGLLFFWEEECNRWRLLDHQEAEILQLLSESKEQDNHELNLALESVRRRRNLIPSQRAEGAADVIPPSQEPPPAYA